MALTAPGPARAHGCSGHSAGGWEGYGQGTYLWRSHAQQQLPACPAQETAHASQGEHETSAWHWQVAVSTTCPMQTGNWHYMLRRDLAMAQSNQAYGLGVTAATARTRHAADYSVRLRSRMLAMQGRMCYTKTSAAQQQQNGGLCVHNGQCQPA